MEFNKKIEEKLEQIKQERRKRINRIIFEKSVDLATKETVERHDLLQFFEELKEEGISLDDIIQFLQTAS